MDASAVLCFELEFVVQSSFELYFQVEELVNKGDYDEALTLAESIDPEDLPNKTEKVKQIRIQYAYHLFAEGNYKLALEYFFSEKACFFSSCSKSSICHIVFCFKYLIQT